jgi:hypothetical protein
MASKLLGKLGKVCRYLSCLGQDPEAARKWAKFGDQPFIYGGHPLALGPTQNPLNLGVVSIPVDDNEEAGPGQSSRRNLGPVNKGAGGINYLDVT